LPLIAGDTPAVISLPPPSSSVPSGQGRPATSRRFPLNSRSRSRTLNSIRGKGSARICEVRGPVANLPGGLCKSRIREGPRRRGRLRILSSRASARGRGREGGGGLRGRLACLRKSRADDTADRSRECEMKHSSALPAAKAGRAIILPRTICSRSPASPTIDSAFPRTFRVQAERLHRCARYASEHAFAAAALRSIRLGDRSI